MSNLLLRHLEQFGPLPPDEKRALTSLVQRVHEIGADQDIVAEGDRPGDCKVILEGFAFRYKLLGSGRRQIMSFQIPGDVVDLQGFLLGEMDHSVATLTATKVGVIPHNLLLKRLSVTVHRPSALAEHADRFGSVPGMDGGHRSAVGLPTDRPPPPRGVSSPASYRAYKRR